mmetsp:Transcript_20447/g.66400  ORF Transcript_20447/g.66400 Transcript_20447/m.66400 type:complete len:229 (+) Transcript_20447:768-1454(+)
MGVSVGAVAASAAAFLGGCFGLRADRSCCAASLPSLLLARGLAGRIALRFAGGPLPSGEPSRFEEVLLYGASSSLSSDGELTPRGVRATGPAESSASRREQISFRPLANPRAHTYSTSPSTHGSSSSSANRTLHLRTISRRSRSSLSFDKKASGRAPVVPAPSERFPFIARSRSLDSQIRRSLCPAMTRLGADRLLEVSSKASTTLRMISCFDFPLPSLITTQSPTST